jgi:hypothetical protein
VTRTAQQYPKYGCGLGLAERARAGLFQNIKNLKIYKNNGHQESNNISYFNLHQSFSQIFK